MVGVNLPGWHILTFYTLMDGLIDYQGTYSVALWHVGLQLSKTADYGDWTLPWYYHMHAVIQVRGVTKSELVFVNDHPAMELRY